MPTRLDYPPHKRIKDAEEMITQAKHLENWALKRVMEVNKNWEENTQSTRKQLQHLQEDHKNRGNKMEGLEKDKIDLKRKNIILEKENIELRQENLDLMKENLALKKGEEPTPPDDKRKR